MLKLISCPLKIERSMNECRRMDVVIIGRKDSHQADHFDEVPTGYQVHSDFFYFWSTQLIFW